MEDMQEVGARKMKCLTEVYGVIQVLRNSVAGEGGVRFPRKKRYEGVRFNIIRGGRGSNFQKKIVS